MLKIRLQSTTGADLGELDFPEAAREVTLQQFLRFEVANEAKEKWLKEQGKVSPSSSAFMAGFVLRHDACVRAFCGQDARLSEIPVGDPLPELERRFGVSGADLDLEQIEATVMNLYANIWRVIRSYTKQPETPEGFSFTFQGKVYRLKSSYRDGITQQVRYESLTVAQYVEASEAMRIYRAAADQDKQKAYLFTTVLTLTACLALADDEQFPARDSDIQRWVSDRVRYFEQLDMEAGLNILDFFFATPKASNASAPSPTTSTRRGMFRRARQK